MFKKHIRTYVWNKIYTTVIETKNIKRMSELPQQPSCPKLNYMRLLYKLIVNEKKKKKGHIISF